MPIRRNSDQQQGTLEEFYSDLTLNSTNHYRYVGSKMLLLIELINQTFKETILWGLTSHARLVIQNKDGALSEWLVIVSNLGDEFYFEYLMPQKSSPWPNARVHGTAKTLEEAKKYLIIAMNESGGWIDNTELKNLLNTI